MKIVTGRLVGAAALAALFTSAGVAWATDLEVTHWWTSGGEAAAVAQFAKAFDASGDHWVDGAIAGGGDTARPIMVSRILGGNPMGAAQFNNLTQVEDLVKAGKILDLTEVAKSEGWDKIVNPKKMLDQCVRDGHVWCVPVNIHSAQWIWINRHVYEDNGWPVPTNWDEFVASAPKLREKGIIPLASGGDWQLNLARGVINVALAGPDIMEAVNGKGDLKAAAGPEVLKAWKAWGDVRNLVDDGYAGRQWNEATAMVIEGKAAAQIMGDWAQGEFAVAGKVAGKDYDCLPGLGAHKIIDAGGDVFIFPKNSNADIEAAQIRLAKLMLSKEVQVSFNLAKGSLPVRSDIDLSAANDCMKKGLAILANPEGVLTAGNVVWTEDTVQRVEDLNAQFFQDKNMTAEQAQAEYVKILSENKK
jgi:glucose/mannose transport system substrate-binding protein